MLGPHEATPNMLELLFPWHENQASLPQLGKAQREENDTTLAS